MKISNDLPQFQGENNLLAVTGEKFAEFYLASDGSIKKITSLSVEDPEYTDREGFFASRGGGRTLGTGSVYEPKKQYTMKLFQKRFLREVTRLISENKINAINLFSPSEIKNSIITFLPISAQKIIQCVILGNFTHRHPFELLKMIKNYKADRISRD